MTQRLSTTRTLRIPQQRSPQGSCPSWCVEAHREETPVHRSHWAAGRDVQMSTGTLCVDLNRLDGVDPLIVLHDSQGEHERGLSLDKAEEYANAILAMVAKGRPPRSVVAT